MTDNEFQKWLSRFILKARKTSADEYPPKHFISHRLQSDAFSESKRQTRDLFKQRVFAEFRATLDTKMKRSQQTGLGSSKRKADALTQAEELLWTSGVLGDHTPQAILNTVFYFNGICLLYVAAKSTDDCASD